MLKLSEYTVTMFLNATEDTKTLLHQGKGNTDVSRIHMIFVCTIKSKILWQNVTVKLEVVYLALGV